LPEEALLHGEVACEMTAPFGLPVVPLV